MMYSMSSLPAHRMDVMPGTERLATMQTDKTAETQERYPDGKAGVHHVKWMHAARFDMRPVGALAVLRTGDKLRTAPCLDRTSFEAHYRPCVRIAQSLGCDTHCPVVCSRPVLEDLAARATRRSTRSHRLRRTRSSLPKPSHAASMSSSHSSGAMRRHFRANITRAYAVTRSSSSERGHGTISLGTPATCPFGRR